MKPSNPYQPPSDTTVRVRQRQASAAVWREALRGAWFGGIFIFVVLAIGSILQWASVFAYSVYAETGFTLSISECLRIVGWQLLLAIPLAFVGGITGAIYAAGNAWRSASVNDQIASVPFLQASEVLESACDSTPL